MSFCMFKVSTVKAEYRTEPVWNITCNCLRYVNIITISRRTFTLEIRSCATVAFYNNIWDVQFCYQMGANVKGIFFYNAAATVSRKSWETYFIHCLWTVCCHLNSSSNDTLIWGRKCNTNMNNENKLHRNNEYFPSRITNNRKV